MNALLIMVAVNKDVLTHWGHSIVCVYMDMS